MLKKALSGEDKEFCDFAIEELHKIGTPEALQAVEAYEQQAGLLEAQLPYDWGEEGPPEGKPVRYEPGVGLVVLEEEET